MFFKLNYNVKKLFLRKKLKKHQIKLFISDIDGTLTDGGMYYDQSGEKLKKFNTRDGMGFEILRKNGIKTALITSENSQLNQKRFEKLKIDFLFQREKNIGKAKVIKEMASKLDISLDSVAYIGDDINCLNALEIVGFKACPNDASEIIKSIAGILVLKSKGGNGCVREFIEILQNN
tara:strand:- start:1075 stop:1605 length:531 start_codon:yes stop_codon:yes gene_type:complete